MRIFRFVPFAIHLSLTSFVCVLVIGLLSGGTVPFLDFIYFMLASSAIYNLITSATNDLQNDRINKLENRIKELENKK